MDNKKQELLLALESERLVLKQNGYKNTPDHDITIQYMNDGTLPTDWKKGNSRMLDAVMNDFETIYTFYCINYKEITNNRIYGEYLGYPSCCIKAFGDVAMPFALRPQLTQKATVNGFLPCESCAKKLLSGEVSYDELINPNRKCTLPFVTNPTPEEDEQLSKELRKLDK